MPARESSINPNSGYVCDFGQQGASQVNFSGGIIIFCLTLEVAIS
jgi:hypothetical protein